MLVVPVHPRSRTHAVVELSHESDCPLDARGLLASTMDRHAPGEGGSARPAWCKHSEHCTRLDALQVFGSRPVYACISPLFDGICSSTRLLWGFVFFIHKGYKYTHLGLI